MPSLSCGRHGAGEPAVSAPTSVDLAESAQRNLNRFVAASFRDRVTVLGGQSGVRLFFPDSESLIVAADNDAAVLRAASLSVMQHVPMVVLHDGVAQDLRSLIADMGVVRVLAVGADVGDVGVEVIVDPGTTEAMGKMTAFRPNEIEIASRDQAAAAVAALDAHDYTELRAAWAPLGTLAGVKAKPLPAQSPRDGQMAPVVVATAKTPLAAVANARAFGAKVRVLSNPDPRVSVADCAMVAGLEDGPLVALGPEFGSSHLLRDRIRQCWDE